MHHDHWLKLMLLYLLDGGFLVFVISSCYLGLRTRDWPAAKATSFDFETRERKSARLPFAKSGPVLLSKLSYRYSSNGKDYVGRQCYRLGMLPSGEAAGRKLIAEIQAELAAKGCFAVYISPANPAKAVIRKGMPALQIAIFAMTILLVSLMLALICAARPPSINGHLQLFMTAFAVGAILGLLAMIVADQVFGLSDPVIHR